MTWRRDELAYCSNVHPGSDLAAVADNLAGPIAGVRARRGLPRMGCGLWLASQAALTLAEDPARLRRLLDDNGLYLFTLNGFPYGDFHRERVKEAVYEPAWDRAERLDYTRRLARILAHCLPEDQREGTISSLPLGFAPAWATARHTRALDHLCVLAAHLAELQTATGRHIRLCLEPEPGCVLETTDQAIALFAADLPAAAARGGVSETALRDHLGICFDVCHQAVMFEDPAESLTRLKAAGIAVGKIQISSALEVPAPADTDIERILGEFAEPRYLHQVRTRTAAGEVTGAMDLEAVIFKEGPRDEGRGERTAGDVFRPWPSPLSPSALPTLARDRPWRIHFHVPIQSGDPAEGALGTTRAAILQVLDRLAADPGLRPHLEVETYTWGVLPAGRRPASLADLEQGLAAELAWLEERMADVGLLAEAA